MPEPQLPARPEPAQHDGPCLAGMEEVGTGILDHVDAMQRVAASAPCGPFLINAGPGTGKTYVLARRIAYHVMELQVPPAHCLVLTPSVDGGEAIRSQIQSLIGDDATDVVFAKFPDVEPSKLPDREHVFVDDFHHMPVPLYEALHATLGDNPAFTAAGDPDLRIDGDNDLFTRFPHDYPDARVVRLSRNHRSTPPILAAAMQVMAPDTAVPGRGMVPARSASGAGPVGRFYAADAADEAAFAKNLPQRLSDYGILPEDVAVVHPEDFDGPVSGAVTADRLGGSQFRAVLCLDVSENSYPLTVRARRALFVAMTRATDLLYVSHSGKPSQLLDDIDGSLFYEFGTLSGSTPTVEQPRLL